MTHKTTANLLKYPLILGIESSCDETSVALVRGKQILSNIVRSSLKYHKKYGGVIPEIASRKHLQLITMCYKGALEKASLKPSEIDAIAVTNTPGLPGSLLVGTSFAKALSYALNKPLIFVNHIEAHLYSNFLTDKPSSNQLKESMPALGLVVSGGHTSLYRLNSLTDFTLIGQTRDDAVGEAFDKVAKILNLGYPGGPFVEACAKKSDDPYYFKPPYIDSNTLDFSFSGIKTAVLYAVKRESEKGEISDKFKADLCKGFQEAVFKAIVKKTIKAAQTYNIHAIYAGGGVSINQSLREHLNNAAQKAGISAHFPMKALCLDNAAMIAGLGAEKYLKKQFELYASCVRPTIRQ